jgi:hypothetical protein
VSAKYTQRGFRIYAEIKDAYGAEVDVIESSAAQFEGDDRGPWVWIFAKGGEIHNNDGSAHLDLRDAIRVRDALNVFIVENS